jgi:hypothetical protein
VSTFGSNQLPANSGQNVVAIGTNNGASNAAEDVVAIGDSNLVGSTQDGDDLIAIGNHALTSLDPTYRNSDVIAMGDYAISSTINSKFQGRTVVGIGVGVLTVNGTGTIAANETIAMGDGSGGTNTSMSEAIEEGIFLGDGAGVNISGCDLISIGDGAGGNFTSTGGTGACGNGNVYDIISIGDGAGSGQTGANSVVSIGNGAGGANSGSEIVSIGTGSGTSNTGDELVSVGDFAGNSNTGTSVVAIGLDAGDSNTGDEVVAIGESAGANNTSSHSVLIGDNALRYPAGTNGDYLVMIGYDAGSGSAYSDGLNGSVAIGAFSGGANVGASDVVAIGYAAGGDHTGDNIVAIGDGAGYGGSSPQPGDNIVAIGNAAGGGSASNIVAVGNAALRGSGPTWVGNTGSDNVAIGDRALAANHTGTNNVAIGTTAGAIGYTGNTAIGNSNTSGSQNTWVGDYSGPNAITQFSNTIALGYQAQVSASNQTVIGNSSITQLILFGTGNGCLSSTAGVITGSGSPCGGGSGTTPTGTGFAHVTSGAYDAAARSVNLGSSDVTGTLGTANGGTGTTSWVAGTNYLTPTGSGVGLTNLNASSLASGTVPSARLPIFTSTVAGAVPLSGGGTTNFLRADGTWAAPAGGSTGNVQYNNGGSSAGDPDFNTDGAGNVTATSYGTSGATTNGLVDLTAAGATAGSVPTSTVRVAAPNSVTAYEMDLPAAQPTGTGQVLTCSNANPSICTWGIANVQITLTTSAVSANSCEASAHTQTMTGLLTTSVLSWTFATDASGVTGWGPATPGLSVDMWPTANALNWKVCNNSASSITPGAMTLNVGAK